MSWNIYSELAVSQNQSFHGGLKMASLEISHEGEFSFHSELFLGPVLEFRQHSEALLRVTFEFRWTLAWENYTVPVFSRSTAADSAFGSRSRQPAQQKCLAICLVSLSQGSFSAPANSLRFTVRNSAKHPFSRCFLLQSRHKTQSALLCTGLLLTANLVCMLIERNNSILISHAFVR
jgi:hypothetical protein